MTVKLPVKMHCTLILAAVAAAALAGCTQRTEATDKLVQAQSRVGISVNAYPSAVAKNANFTVSTVVFNAGELTLPSLGKANTDQYRVGMSYHWRQLDEKVVVWDGTFTPLKADLKKGSTQEIDMPIKAPAEPGRYFLEIDVLQNSAFWFGGVGSQFARITIDVK